MLLSHFIWEGSSHLLHTAKFMHMQAHRLLLLATQQFRMTRRKMMWPANQTSQVWFGWPRMKFPHWLAALVAAIQLIMWRQPLSLKGLAANSPQSPTYVQTPKARLVWWTKFSLKADMDKYIHQSLALSILWQFQSLFCWHLLASKTAGDLQDADLLGDHWCLGKLDSCRGT